MNLPPQELVFHKASTEWPRYVRRWPFWFCGGDWDIGGTDRPLPRLKRIRELFIDKVPYRESTTYAKLYKQLTEHGRTRFPKLYSESDIDAYFHSLEELYNRIRSEGFRSQQELGGNVSNEITARIDRNGRYLKCREGNHRLAIALLLEIETIPVAIDLVHTCWARRCVREYRTTPYESVLGKLQEKYTIAAT